MLFCRTHWGENLRVVGSLPELVSTLFPVFPALAYMLCHGITYVPGAPPALQGNWDVSKAPQMQWHEGHKWVLEIRLPKTTFEFKVRAPDAMQDSRQCVS